MTVQVLLGDCRELLRALPDESVHCVVTSPPYYGLRDYGVAGQIGQEPTLADYLATIVAVFTVLDPFGGAGTTGLVAARLGRDAILIDLSPKYVPMARRRIAQDAPLFDPVASDISTDQAQMFPTDKEAAD